MKYGISFILLALTVTYISILNGGYWLLLNWFSLSLFIISLGYFGLLGLGVKVFGKDENGRIGLVYKILHLPTFLYSSLLWNALRLTSKEDVTNQIEDIIIGRRLLKHEIPKNINNYIDLTCEFEDPKEIRKSEAYINFPILDGHTPPVAELKSCIRSLKPGTTFIHCAQGHGRTGLFTIALLFERGKIKSLEEGLTILKSVRPLLALNKSQKNFIREYIHLEP